MNFLEKRFQAIVAANRELQTKAREFNLRAGEPVFPIMSANQWKEWLAGRLAGVARKSEISNLDILRLPALRADEIALVLELNPSTLSFLGKEVVVEYYHNPRVRIDFRGEESKNWLQIPDEGIRLPGGRELYVYSVVEGYDYYIEAPSTQFKAKVQQCLNQSQWSRWADQPVISVPTEIVDETVLPEIVTAIYGTCVVTGEQLTAFGTLTASRYWASDPIVWKPEWFRSRAEAEAAFNKAQIELKTAKIEACEKREREMVQKTAEAAKSHAKDLYGEHCSYSSTVPLQEGELRDRLYGLYYAHLPSDTADLREWTIKANAIIAEVELAVAEGKRIEEERLAEQARAEMEAERQFGSIPDQLLPAFKGNKVTAFAFMQKVAQLPTKRISRHIIQSCGRDKVRIHLIEISGDPDFFLGADPNSVVWYVNGVHLHRSYAAPEPTVLMPPLPADSGSPKRVSLEGLVSQWGAKIRR